ncbi:MAG: tRNA pseudouridine(55) synthase TruB [Bdellovibrionaceae bacterium]|nr:tRNA pseudouridine(55) synthase TruB [Pseudobdellovibrionaceae bacterium]
MLEKNGLLLLDKPAGWTSHDVVARARRILNMKSIGHSGTLDPMATGLMVLLLGEATKLSQYILEKDKGYELEVRFGITTSTFDAEGEVVSEKPIEVSEAEIEAAARGFVGEMELPVPAFSAIKVDGQKLMDRARRGEDFTPPMKTMHFFDLEILGQAPGTLRAHISCSKGTYIRTWAHELGQRLGCGAHLTALRRTVSEPHRLGDAVTFEQLENMVAEDRWSKGFVPMNQALSEWKSVRAQGNMAHLLSNGQISHDLKAQLIRIFKPGEDRGVQVLNANGQILALIGLEAGKGFTLRRVFRY